MPHAPHRIAIGLASLALSAANASSSIPLHGCHLPGLAEAVLCGQRAVFENLTTQQGRQLEIQFAVLPARQRSHAPDPLVLLAGGPGQGARDYARWADRIFREVRQARDLVLVDVRGTGDSQPLRCQPDARSWSRPATSGEPVVNAKACLARITADVRWYGNEAIATDLDSILSGLGYDRINLWGGSFGTRTALVFARLFPQWVRSVVLDSAAPFELVFPQHLADDTERALERLLVDCAEDPDCGPAFPRLRTDLARLLIDLDRAPRTLLLPNPTTGSHQEVVMDTRLVANAIRGALYSPFDSSMLPFAITRAASGDYGPLYTLPAGLLAVVDKMAFGATLSVLCTEDVPRLERSSNTVAPSTLLGSAMADEWRAMCRDWPAGPSPDLAPRLLSIPALIFSGELDPATPPRWGEAMARNFSGATHVVMAGAAHNAGLDGCGPELIAQFVERGSAAGLDLACASRGSRPPFAIGPTGPRP